MASSAKTRKLRTLASMRQEPLAATEAYLSRMALSLIPSNLIEAEPINKLPIVETGLDGALAFVRFADGRLFYSYPSSVVRMRQYFMVRDRLAKTIKAETFGAVVDVLYRYFGAGSPDSEYLPGVGGTIIEAGAYIGLKALRYAELVGPEGRVIAVEIDPFNYQVMRRNVAANALEEVIHCVHAGVWNADGRAVATNRGYQTHSLVPLSERQSGAETEVGTVRIDGLIAEFGLGSVDYLNIQVNGAEINALEGCRRRLGRISAFNVATGYSVDGKPLRPQVLEWFAQEGLSAMPHPDWPDLIIAFRS